MEKNGGYGERESKRERQKGARALNGNGKSTQGLAFSFDFCHNV
jgi:hypothetical protein